MNTNFSYSNVKVVTLWVCNYYLLHDASCHVWLCPV